MPTLEKAIQIATEVHEGQKDLAGEPYILHPLRVMMRFTDETLRIVAVLHDVLEDSEVKDIAYDFVIYEEFGSETLDVLRCLTRNKKIESYQDYIKRCAANPSAVKVKMADLTDNMDVYRIKNPTKKDIERMEKYGKAYDFLVSEYYRRKYV